MRQTRNQIKADISNARLAQNRRGPVNIRPPVHPPRRHQFLVRERLQPKAHPVNSRPYPCRRLFILNRLRVRLQRHLFKLRSVGPVFRGGPHSKRSPDHIQNVFYMNRLKQTRRPAPDVDRVNSPTFSPVAGFTLWGHSTAAPSVTGQTPSPIHSRRLQELPMSMNLPANCLHIRRKPATRHHSGMKITIGTLRLAERYLHVNPELTHHSKTLAHPCPNQPRAPILLMERWGSDKISSSFSHALPDSKAPTKVHLLLTRGYCSRRLSKGKSAAK